jgi:multidrug resistance protein, MATE family
MSAPPSTEAPAPLTLASLIHLAWPIVISRASQTVVGLCDAVMVAQLGATALSATTTGGLNSFAFLILPMGVTFIVSSFSAQHFGRGDLAAARRYGWYGLGVAVAAQVLGGLGLIAAPSILELLPHDAEVKRLMYEYMVLRLSTGGAAIGIEALGSYYGGLGRTRPAMTANVVAMGLNVILNWVLIFGHLGAQAMGVRGAALASALATLLAFVGLFAFFLVEGRSTQRSPLQLAEFGRMLRFGIPSGINWLAEFSAYIFFVNVVVSALGTASVAALNSVMQLSSVAFMPAFALATAGSILVGQALGAERRDDVPTAVRLTLKATTVWMGLVGVVYLLAPGFFLSFFASGEGGAAVQEVGVRMLMVSAAWQLFDATAMTYAEALRAAGDTVFPMMARVALAWLIFVPGAYFSVSRFGVAEVGATAWLVAYLAFLALVTWARFRSGAWRSMKLVDPLA